MLDSNGVADETHTQNKKALCTTSIKSASKTQTKGSNLSMSLLRPRACGTRCPASAADAFLPSGLNGDLRGFSKWTTTKEPTLHSTRSRVGLVGRESSGFTGQKERKASIGHEELEVSGQRSGGNETFQTGF